MPGTVYPLVGHPLSRREIAKFMGKGPKQEFLDFHASRDVVHNFDDFLVDTINLDYYAVANGGGASVASFAVNVQRDGWIRATTGTGNGNTASASLIGPAIYYGQANAGIEVRFKPVTAVTETMIEVGFIDVVPSDTKAGVNDVSTISVNASVVEAALYHYRHASTTTTNIFASIGTAISAQKTAFTPSVVIAAAKSYTVRIQLMKTGAATADVHGWFNGLYVGRLATGMTGAVALAPWAYIQATNATSKSVDLDYIRTWQLRDFATSGLEL